LDKDLAEMTVVGEVAKMGIKLVNTITSYDPFWMTKEHRAGVHQLPLEDTLVNKVNNDVATTHEAPRIGTSVANAIQNCTAIALQLDTKVRPLTVEHPDDCV
jgi:hypothetical protein